MGIGTFLTITAEPAMTEQCQLFFPNFLSRQNTGKDQIEVGDHVVIFALHSAIAGLERQMMVDLRYF